MSRKSSSVKAIREPSVGSDKGNTARSTSYSPTLSLSQDNNHSAPHGQQDLLGIDGDASKPMQTENLDGPEDITKISKQDISHLLLGCGSRFDGNSDIDGTKGTAGNTLNDLIHQQQPPKTHCCMTCTRLELFIADDEASSLLHTSTNSTTLEDNKIKASRKFMGMKLKRLEREIQGDIGGMYGC